MSTPASCTLTASLASAAPVGIVLRRGPTEQVCVIHWDLKRDQFEVGQWLKGRILDSALSPSGNWLVLFCSKHGRTWTSLSKPPYLTAYAVWHKDDHWLGGGVFLSDHHLLLKHSEAEVRGNAFSGAIPDGMRVDLADPREVTEIEIKARSWQSMPPEMRHSGSARAWVKTARLGHRMIQTNRGRFTIEDPDGTLLADVSSFHWRDLDLNGPGDLLFSSQGRLYRLPAESLSPGFKSSDEMIEASKLLADLTDLTFEPRKPPDWALPPEHASRVS